MGNLNLAQSCLQGSPEAVPFLENVERTVLRAADLTKQMLAYSGRGQMQVGPQDLNQVVREIIHLMRVSIPKGISMKLHLGRNLPAVEADAAQIQQVVMNLVSNAAEAIGDREGLIIVGTRTVELAKVPAPMFLPAQRLKPGRYVVMDISDTGCGMAQEVLERIFDPFFTTKPSGRGLGLSAMLGILRGHGAGIKIRSEAGKGSTFELFFPASDAEAPPPSPWERPLLEAFTGKVMLVDDEDIVLEATGAALAAMGFEVVRARDGVQALEAFEAHWETLRLVLMDVTMPRMDGRKAFRAMHKAHPEIPVLLSSGYDKQASMVGARLTGLAGFLQKPYRIPELRKALALALDSPR
jgi:CheY-like chemotaxis protein